MEKQIFAQILSAKRKRFFGSKLIFEKYKSATDLEDIEGEFDISIPASIKSWLINAGYGDIGEVLSFRREWFNIIELGELEGHIIFAQDDLGNFYSISPHNDAIHYICRHEPEFALMTNSFIEFLTELLQRNYELREWCESLNTQKYSWSA